MDSELIANGNCNASSSSAFGRSLTRRFSTSVSVLSSFLKCSEGSYEACREYAVERGDMSAVAWWWCISQGYTE
jgi:hypothetical protein